MCESTYGKDYLDESWEVGLNMFLKAAEYKKEEVTYQTYLFDRLLMALNGKVMSYQDYKDKAFKQPKQSKPDTYYADIVKRAKEVFK